MVRSLSQPPGALYCCLFTADHDSHPTGHSLCRHLGRLQGRPGLPLGFEQKTLWGLRQLVLLDLGNFNWHCPRDKRLADGESLDDGEGAFEDAVTGVVAVVGLVGREDALLVERVETDVLREQDPAF